MNRTLATTLVTGAAAALAVGCASTGQGHKITTAAQRHATHSTPTAQARPNPDGKYRGSCDYTLPEGLSPGATVVGEIDARNTGNVGEVVNATITWPQEGYDPIKVTRHHVRLPYGGHQAIRFHQHISGTQIDRLQSWQEGHGFADGCHYHVTIVDTFGRVR